MIETDRLTLRAWQTSDLQFLDAILGDTEVMEFSDQGALSKEEQVSWLTAARTWSHQDRLPGTLAIEQIDDRRVIGYIGLSRDLRRIGRREAELGFRLAKSAWEHGFATEAAKGILEAAIGLDELERIVAIVDPHNYRSMYVLKRIGMSYQKDIPFESYDYPDHLFVKNF